jgi:hypothetical protein
MVFMMLFVGLVLVSDTVCFVLLPSSWLLFAASNYVWVQLLWQSDRSIGIGTVSIWLLFVYFESNFRFDSPLHLDLNRPFAAHCIGYPVVTLGFGIKSYLEFRIQNRREKAVKQENAFYFKLIEKALPDHETTTDLEMKQSTHEVGQPQEADVPSTLSDHEERQQNRWLRWLLSQFFHGKQEVETNMQTDRVVANGEAVVMKRDNGKKPVARLVDVGDNKASVKLKQSNRQVVPPKQRQQQQQTVQSCNKQHGKQEQQLQEQRHQVAEHRNKEVQHQSDRHQADKSQTDKHRVENDQPSPQSHKHTEHDGGGKVANSIVAGQKSMTEKNGEEKKAGNVTTTKQIPDFPKSSDMDMERQLAELTVSERRMREENERLKASNEEAGQQMDELRRRVQHNGEELMTLDKKLRGEKEARETIERELECERNKSVSEEELKRVTRNLTAAGEKIKRIEMEKQSLERQLAHIKENAKKETDMLMSALSAMQEKNTHLENSLSAETRIKLDLFSALGEAKRNVTIAEDELVAKGKLCDSLERRIAELMALLPPSAIEHEKDMQLDSRKSTRNFHSEDSTY